MNRRVVFRQQARCEFDEAAEWYEKKRAGLGIRFVTAVESVLEQASANPSRYAVAHGEVREGIVRGFPFCVYFFSQNEVIVVLAVFHASRDPEIWKSRVE